MILNSYVAACFAQCFAQILGPCFWYQIQGFFNLAPLKPLELTYLGPILNSQHVFEEHHVPSTAASDAFGGELADAGAFLADVGCNLAGCTVMGLIVMKSS